MRALALLAGLLVIVPAVGLKAPERAHDPPLSTVVTTPTPARELAANQHWSYQIDEATLSRSANAWAEGQSAMYTPLGDVHLRNLVATLRDHQLVIAGDASAGWVTQPVRLTAAATTAHGRVLLRISELTVGAIVISEATRQQAEAQVQHQLDNLLAGHRAVVDSVQIANGYLSLSGTQS